MMNESSDDFQKITNVINDYFEGLYEAKIDKLKSAFHENVYLTAKDVYIDRETWLNKVTERPVPKDQNEPYNFKVFSIDVTNDVAMAKVGAPILGNNFVDYLSFFRENGKWSIVNKIYTTV